MMQGLFKENGTAALDASAVNVVGERVEAAPSGNEQSLETYVDYCQAERFSSPGRFGRHSLPTCRVCGLSEEEDSSPRPLGLSPV